MILSNASPLIYLSKLNKPELLKKLFKEIVIPKKVYEEVIIRGKEGKFFDVYKIEKAISDNWIKVKECRINEEIKKFASEIDAGEIELISLAKSEKADLILIDDASARTIAEIFGFNVKGTLYVLLKSYKQKLINDKEFKNLLKNLISSGFRISSEIYAQLLEEINKKI